MNLYRLVIEAGYSVLGAVTPYKAWEYYNELLRNQYLPENQLRKLQWKKFIAIIKHAYENVPLYQKKFRDGGVSPDDIKEADDIRKIPFTTRQELSEAFPRATVANGLRTKDLTSIKTSGTTQGRPFRLYIDKRGLNRKYALLLRNYSFLNWHFGKKIMALWNQSHEDYLPPAERSLLKALIYKFVHRKEFLPPFRESSRFSSEAGMDYYRRISTSKPHLLEADAFMLYHIGKFFVENNLTLNCIEAVSSATCSTTAPLRKKLGEMFNAPVFNNYGPHEMEGIACECSEHKGLHQSIDSYFIEFIKDDKPAAENELAELVLTDFDNFAMPFIRYKIGDLIKAGTCSCSCGRTLPLMNEIEGRATDVLRSGKGVFTENCIQIFFGKFGLENQFQIVQHSEQRFSLKIISSKTLMPSLLNRIEREFRELLGDDINLTIEIKESIACEESGKFRPVKSVIRYKG